MTDNSTQRIALVTQGRSINDRFQQIIPESKVHGANMGPIWGRQDPGGPHVGSMNLAIWDITIKVMWIT